MEFRLKQIEIALDEIENFGKHSGLILNRQKTEGLLVGNLKSRDKKLGNVKWSKGPIKALGVYFGQNKQECIRFNWEDKIKNIENIIKNWLRRNLTFFGKIKIIKTLILSKLVYLAQSITIPKDILKTIDSLIYNFLWHGKREKIKRTTLIGQTEYGGIEMCDTNSFFKSLKFKWIKMLIDKTDANWKILPNYFLEIFGENFLIFNMNLENLKSIKNYNTRFIPSFYLDIINTWLQINQLTTLKPNTYKSIRKSVICGNRYIKFRGQCLIFKNWIESGIIFINDIIDINGNISDVFLLNKLRNKCDWISEISKLKAAIPTSWKTILKDEHSIKSKIKTSSKLRIYINKKLIDIDSTQNKQIYNILISQMFSKPYVHTYWNQYFDSIFIWEKVYKTLHSLKDNRIKQFKYKLINRVVPSKEIRFKWKVIDSPLCVLCNITESYNHLFINCKYLDDFWNTITLIFKAYGIENNIKKLKYIVIGYKIKYPEYKSINTLFSLIGFSI